MFSSDNGDNQRDYFWNNSPIGGLAVKIEILGVGCPKCKQLTANAEAAVKELKIQAEIGKVTDIDKITEYGVMMTPALVIDRTLVSSGKLLTKDEIKKLILK